MQTIEIKCKIELYTIEVYKNARFLLGDYLMMPDEPVELFDGTDRVKTDTNDLIVFHNKRGGTVWVVFDVVAVLIAVLFAFKLFMAALSATDFMQKQRKFIK